MKYPALTSFALVALAASAGAALAVQSRTEPDDAVLLEQATVPLGQAVTLAEGRTGGRAVEVALEGQPSGPAWFVTTVDRTGESRVAVDARSGALTPLTAEEGDDGEDDDD
jgi:hypothetical protein